MSPYCILYIYFLHISWDSFSVSRIFIKITTRTKDYIYESEFLQKPTLFRFRLKSIYWNYKEGACYTPYFLYV